MTTKAFLRAAALAEALLYPERAKIEIDWMHIASGSRTTWTAAVSNLRAHSDVGAQHAVERLCGELVAALEGLKASRLETLDRAVKVADAVERALCMWRALCGDYNGGTIATSRRWIYPGRGDSFFGYQATVLEVVDDGAYREVHLHLAGEGRTQSEAHAALAEKLRTELQRQVDRFDAALRADTTPDPLAAAQACNCEACGKDAEREPGTFVPAGWFYHEVRDDSEFGSEVVTCIYACSEACKGSLTWQQGPGSLDAAGLEPIGGGL